MTRSLTDRLPTDALDGEERAHLRNRLIGFVFQHHYLLDELDALDNVALPLVIAGMRRKELGKRARAAAHAVIERFGYLQLDTVSVAGARSHAG